MRQFFAFRKFFKKHISLLLAGRIVVALLFIALVFSDALIYAVRLQVIKRDATRVERAIQNELDGLLEHARDIAASPAIAEHIRRRDSFDLLGIANDEVNKRDFSMMLITDASGIALARTRVVSKRGDYVFQVASWGREVARGNEVATMDRGTAHSLVLIAGARVHDNGVPVGAVFPAQRPDNEYAGKFREKYLSERRHVAWYADGDGILGSSFTDPEALSVVRSHFNAAQVGELSRFDRGQRYVVNGTHYFVSRISIDGIDESAGGALLFVEVRPWMYGMMLGGILALLFLLIEWVHHGRNIVVRGRKQKRAHMGMTVVAACVVATATTAAGVFHLHHGSIDPSDMPFTIYNATMRFDPDSDIVDRAFEQRVAIAIDIGGETINAAEAVIRYDPARVAVREILTTRSFCHSSLFIRRDIDNEKGEVAIACGVPAPGYAEPRGILAELALQPLGTGAYTLEFGEETKVLAHDGLGTNVLRAVTNGSYQVVSIDEQLRGGADMFAVFSYTHPNSARWYASRAVRLGWPRLEGYRYRYAINDEREYMFRNDDTTTEDNMLSLIIPDDGVYYFHIRAEKEGAASLEAHFRIMVDATPPAPPDIRVSEQSVKVGEVVRLDISSRDTLSGIQNVYYIRINNGILLPLRPPVFIPFLSPGDHLITVRAFDNAGNFSDSTTSIRVRR